MRNEDIPTHDFIKAFLLKIADIVPGCGNKAPSGEGLKLMWQFGLLSSRQLLQTLEHFINKTVFR